MTQEAPSGSGLRFELRDDLPQRVLTADGTEWVARHDDGDACTLRLRLPDHRHVSLVLDSADHPVLGRCDRVVDEDGKTLAHGTAIDWRRPTQIPALDSPGALPRGAGTAILNLLAWQAKRARSGPLRYRGPYPSTALWGALKSSFRVDDPEGTAHERFVAEASDRMASGRHGPIAIDFHPAPHVWSWEAARVCVQRRAGVVERIYVDGHAFDRDGGGIRRLRADGAELRCVIDIGLQPWHEVLTVGPQRQAVDSEIKPVPPAPTDLLGVPLPKAVVELVAGVVVEQAPGPLQEPMRALIHTLEIVWGDVPHELVRAQPGLVELHASVVTGLPTNTTALMGALVQLVEGPLRRIAVQALAHQWSRATLTV